MCNGNLKLEVVMLMGASQNNTNYVWIEMMEVPSKQFIFLM